MIQQLSMSNVKASVTELRTQRNLKKFVTVITQKGGNDLVSKFKLPEIVQLVLALSVIISCHCPRSAKAASGKPAWYNSAISYIQYDELIFGNKVKSTEEAAQILKSKARIEDSLLSASQPADTELGNLLRSADQTDRKVALVNIMLRRIADVPLYREIIGVLRSESDMLTRFYAYHCLANLDSEHLDILKEDFLDVIISETNDGNIITAMPILTKVDSSRVVDLFVKYFSKGSRVVKEIACLNFDKIQRELQKQIMDQLGAKDRPECLRTKP